MINQQQSFQQTIYPYIQLLLRRKWIVIFTSIPILILGLLYCLTTHLTYKAEATIVVVPQKVPESYVRSTVTGRNDERIRGILQEITSRTTLEKLIKKYDLYPDMRKKYPMETVIENMKKRIEISNPRGAKQNAFNISFEGENPKLVADVTNALANMFVEHNLKLRESQSLNTAKFLSEQLDKIYVELKKREETLKQYKTKYMGELPEQRESNLATLAALQQQLQNIQENIRRAEDRRLLLRQQLADQRASISVAQMQRNTASGHPSGNRGLSLPELRERLRVLLSRYTENHPDVIALKRAIERQEKRLKKKEGSSSSAPTPTLTGDPALDALRLQLRSTEFEINQLKEEKGKVLKQIARYQKRIENTPKREQELLDLTRDYENLKQTYDDLLQKKLEAEQAAALERHQQGEQFRIIDPARIPEMPIKPNLKRVLPIILVLALCLGGGLAFVVDFLSNKYYDPDEVESDYDIDVLACIPALLSPDEIKARRLKNILLTVMAGVGYLCVAGLLVLLFIKGPGSFSGLI